MARYTKFSTKYDCLALCSQRTSSFFHEFTDGDSRIVGKLYPIITDILNQRGLLTTRTVGLVGE